MGAVEIERALEERARALKKNKPELDMDRSIEEGEWGLLTLREEGILVGFEFLETESSFSRPDALLQYFEAAKDGYYVGVVVPESKLGDVTELIYGRGEGPVKILTYEGLGITPYTLA